MSRKFKRAVSSFMAAMLLLLTGLLGIPSALAETDASSSKVTVYHETFAAGQELVVQSGGPALTLATDKVFAGNEDGAALYVSERSDNWDAVDVPFSGLGLEDGRDYTVTASVYVDAGEVVPDGSTFAMPIILTDDSNRLWKEAAMEPEEAVELTQQFTYDSSTDKALRIQTNEAGKEVPFYIGDILITTALEPEESDDPSEKERIAFYDFEDGVQGWTARGDGNTTISVTTEKYEGEQALLVEGRSAGWHGMELNHPGLEAGATYEISAYVKLAAGQAVTETNIKLSENDGDSYPQIIAPTLVNQHEWTHLQATYTATVSTIYFEAPDDENASFIIDQVEISLLEPAPDVKPDQYTYDFDDGTTQSWTARGGGTLEVVTDHVVSAPYALQHSGRTDTWNGPSLNVRNLLDKNVEYEISGKVMLRDKTGEASTVKLSMEYQAATEDAATNWATIDQVEVSTSDWVSLSGTYEFSEDMANLTLYVESSDKDDVMIIDDFTIRASYDQSGIVSDFEDGLQGWVARDGSGTVEWSDADNHTEGGSHSLLMTAPYMYNGALLDVLGKMHRNHQYELSAWVKMAPGQSATTLRISVQFGESTFTNVSQNAVVTDSEWVLLKGVYTVASTPKKLNAYIEVAEDYGEPRSFYLDDFRLVHLGSVDVPDVQDLTPIKEVYKDDFLIGNAVTEREFTGERLKLLKMHHDIVTAENAMKPEQNYDADRKFDLTAEDALVDQALAEGLQVFGHVLVWHQQSPNWLHADDEGVPLSREEALANLRNHVQTVVAHFADRVIGWDVVNEAMSDNPPIPEDWRASLRQSGWYHAIGEDYIKQAFLAAQEVLDANPEWEDLKLYYNDYNLDNQNKAEAVYHMVKEINEEYAAEHPGELLIDGIGMQGHYNIYTNPENVRLSLERFSSLGVEVSITELDITAGENRELSAGLAAQQGYLYAQLFQIFKQYSDHIARVTFWGLDDGTSWRSEGSPLLFDSSLQAKPAYYAVIDPETYIEEYDPVDKEVRETVALYGTPVIDGEIDEVWSQTVEIPIDRYQMAWQGANGMARALWDEENLYVLVQVIDDQLDKSSENAYEQDSVEVFLDQNNAKSTSYQSDDGQYRVNYENETSFNPLSIAEGFESAVQVEGTNYTVEMKIPLTDITPAHNVQLGFDVQINDGNDGSRESVAIWNDLTGQGYQDPSVFGVLTLKTEWDEEEEDEEDDRDRGRSRSRSNTSSSQTRSVKQSDGTVTITPTMLTRDGTAMATISEDHLQEALAQADLQDGKKLIAIRMPGADVNSYEVQLPAQSLRGSDDFALVIETETASLDIPSDMLSNVTAETEQVSIRVSAVSPDNLDDAVREQTGDRPVIGLRLLTASGEELGWNNPDAPVTVSIPYTPTEEELQNPDHIVVWYIDGEGNVTAIPNGRFNEKTGSVVFSTTHFSTFAVASVFKTFDDLQHVSWAKEAIEVLAARDVIRGNGENRFMPSKFITRADYIALLVRVLELQSAGEQVVMFADVADSAYYVDELRIAKELGILPDTGSNLFQPSNDISREEMMVLTVRALTAAGMLIDDGEALDAYPDAASVSDYARESVEALVASKLIVGKDGKLAPSDPLTRAEAAMVLYRIWKR